MKTFSNFIKKNTDRIEALTPFSIALALLVFTFVPTGVRAATYYIDIPNLSSYGSGSSYRTNHVSNPNSYPNYAYQYYKDPNPGAATNGSQNNGVGAYVPTKASYTPYDFPIYVQYVKQADGTYKLGAPKTPPAYAWNADNSLPSSISGYGSFNNGYSNGSTGRGFTITSSGF